MKNNLAGHLGEFMARSYMRLLGYHIVTKNFVTGKGTHSGEIDFIAARGKTLVFVEVKKRTDIETAAYAIREKQQQRIRNGATAFLQKNPQFSEYNIRFDAILIAFPCQIKHIENAF